MVRSHCHLAAARSQATPHLDILEGVHALIHLGAALLERLL